MNERDSKGKFKKGLTPWNKGLKGFRPSPETSFKEGQFNGDDHPSWKGGVQVIAKDCIYSYTGVNQRVRRPRQVWESINGPIPKGYVIIHLDGNRYNDDINNLDCISRADNLKRNRK